MLGYTLNENKYIRDLKCDASVYTHDKTGARVVLLPVDDENRSISIAFSTPSENSCGLAHIIEHSVLCGSKKYPLKDPFVQLMKGSMYSFLNALTSSDFTIYPVASTNEKDFKNLADVYLDAVFNPLLPNKKEVFLQEGKHYLLDGEKRCATAFNGVVYNEMRGVASSYDYYLQRAINTTLYEGTPYEYESGGDPLAIADLTFETLRDFYLRHYTASNAVIFLYGKIDAEDMLPYISEEYLNKYSKSERYSVGEIPKENKTKLLTMGYPADENDLEKGYYYALSFVLHKKHSPLLSLTLRVLERILSSSQGAYIKNEMLKKGIGEEFYSFVDESIKAPMFNFTAGRCTKDDGDEFRNTVLTVLEDLYKNGIDKEKLRSALRIIEFNERENADGWLPRGIEYGFQMLPKFLYDEENPLEMLEFFDAIDELKKLAETDYFENFIKENFLENRHFSFVTLEPDSAYSQKVDRLLNEKCVKNASKYSYEELKADLDLLDAYRQSEDTPELAAKIPILERSDLSPKSESVPSEKIALEKGEMIFQQQPTNSIAYFDFLFDLRYLSEQEMRYFGIFSELIGSMDTKEHTYSQLSDLIDSYTGSLVHSLLTADASKNGGELVPYLDWHTRFLYENTDRAFEINKEILLSTDFSDTNRILDLLKTQKSGYMRGLTEASHSYAKSIGLSAYSQSYAFENMLTGYGFYKFLCSVLDDFDSHKDKLVRMMNSIRQKLLDPVCWKICFVGEREYLDEAKKFASRFLSLLDGKNSGEKVETVPLTEKRDSAFFTPGQVQFNALCGVLPEEADEFRGNLLVLSQLLNTDYLWHNIRVLGGAYGCFASFDYTGEVCMVSYRDPRLKETVDCFRKTVEYINSLDMDERQVRQFVIGAFSKLKKPKTPYNKGFSVINRELCNIDPSKTEKIRQQLIDTSLEQLKALCPFIEKWIEEAHCTVIGSEQKVKENSDGFRTVSQLL